MNHISQDIEKILISGEAITARTKELAEEIMADYADSDRRLLLISILKGSVMFTAELMKQLDIDCDIDFMKVSSYGCGTKSTLALNVLLDLKQQDLTNIDILIVEDIIDSGNTLSHLTNMLRGRGANSVKICTLLDKPSRRIVDLKPDYCGFEVPDCFVVGYGLDYAEKYRNLPYVGVLKPEIYLGEQD